MSQIYLCLFKKESTTYKRKFCTLLKLALCNGQIFQLATCYCLNALILQAEKLR